MPQLSNLWNLNNGETVILPYSEPNILQRLC